MTNQYSSPISRTLIVLAAFVIVVAGMRASSDLLVPFFLSLFIAIISSPLVSWLNARGIPAVFSILLVIVSIVVFASGIGAIVGTSINDFRGDLPQYQERLLLLSDNWLQKLDAMGISIAREQWREIFNPSIALTMVGNVISSFGSLMTNGFLILLTVSFILAEGLDFPDKIKYAIKDGGETLKALDHFTSSVNKYIALKTIISLATGLLIMLCLLLLGIDYAILWGLIAFLLNFVPSLGSLIASVPTIIFALVQYGMSYALITAVIYVAVNTLVGSILEPRFMGKNLNLSPLIVFLSLVFWGWVLGPVGMLLSVPLTITVKIALESFNESRWIAIILGGALDNNKATP